MVKKLNKKRLFITFVLIIILSVFFLSVKIDKEELEQINLRVLLLTSEDVIKSTSYTVRDNTIFGLYNHFNHEETAVFMNYLDLISSNNIPYDIFIYKDGNLEMDSLVEDRILKYSVIIIAMPLNNVSDSSINTIKNISKKYGVSVISSYDYLDPRLNEIFGISDVLNDEEFSNMKINKGFLLKEEVKNLSTNNKNYSKFKKVTVHKDAIIIARSFPELDPLIISKKYGKAKNYYFAFQKKDFLNDFGITHNLVRSSIIENSGSGMAFIDLTGYVVLRMDDPGSAIKIYSDYCHYPELNKNKWENISQILNKYNFTLNIGYCSGWVDDGNSTRGILYVNQTEIKDKERECGKIYNSREIIYTDKEGWLPKEEWNYIEEYQSLLELSKKGAIDIESHGYTHMNPNLELWCGSKKYFSNWWKVELGDMEKDKMDTPPSYNEQRFIIEKSSSDIEELFNKSPTTLILPCHRRSEYTDFIAKDKGFKLVSSNILTIIKKDNLIRNDKIIAVSLNDTKEEHLLSGYPMVWFFHDFDISTKGVIWFEEKLKELTENNNINKIITLRELTGYLNSVIETKNYLDRLEIEVDISDTGGTKNEIQSRYFYNNNMKIIVKIPEKKEIHGILVDGKEHYNYKIDYIDGIVEILLPYFDEKNNQTICINFK
jgi:hypothetical protein